MNSRCNVIPRSICVRFAIAIAFAAVAMLRGSPARGATLAGENVNMVSGTQWPGGDPFLQRQNEPSIAVSSINPQHLLAGANDYRTVDLPDPLGGADAPATADAWLGVFKSLDGGQTWKSILLPGYPQDPACHPQQGQPYRSPLCVSAKTGAVMPAGADPVVRAGTDGLFYYSGINFLRDKSQSRVFVSRFLDLNNKENGDATKDSDAIKYVDTHVVATAADGIFIDKPWMAVDVPRTGARPATIVAGGTSRQVSCGTVYLGWAEFPATGPETSSDIKVTWSTDCGETWVSPPVRLNSANSTLNQGVTMAIEPISGRLYVAWRRAKNNKQTDAIMATRLFGRKELFARPRVVANNIPAFDQPSSTTSFRSNALPTLAISSNGTSSWAHVAWAQRKSTGESRIVMSTAGIYPPPSGDQDDDDPEDYEFETRVAWSQPSVVDDAPLTDDTGNAFSQGHQVMPAMTFGQGRLVLVYYDTRLDHTRRYYHPNAPTIVAGGGPLFTQELAPIGELTETGGTPYVFNSWIDDFTLHSKRHTVEVRVAVAPAGGNPVFSSSSVSRFPFGLRGDEGNPTDSSGNRLPLTVPNFKNGQLTVVGADGALQVLQQLQLNPPNFPMFKGGTVAFMGDYIDVQGPAFALKDGSWQFNVASTAAPVFHATWTSNQDVRIPPATCNASGQCAPDWTRYTPVVVPELGPNSIFDPSKTRPGCVFDSVGSRDQNIYTSRITEGLLVSSPQNMKPLSSTTVRAFVIQAQNATASAMTVSFEAVVPKDADGNPVLDASFVNGAAPASSTTRIAGIVIPARSSVYRSVFVTLNAPNASPTFAVTVSEMCGTSNCRTGSVTLNPPIALASLVDPDGSNEQTSMTGAADYDNYGSVLVDARLTDPNWSNPNWSNFDPDVDWANPNWSNPEVTNPNWSNPNWSNPNWSNPNWSNWNWTSPNWSNPNWSNPNWSNPNWSNPNWSNPNWSNPNWSNTPISDLNATIQNTGNTTTNYHVKIVDTSGGALKIQQPLQLLVTKTYATPAAESCVLKEVAHHQLVVSVPNVPLVASSALIDPKPLDTTAGNATVALAPGESATLTLRGAVTLAKMAEIGASTAPAAVPAGYIPTGLTYEDAWKGGSGTVMAVPGAPTITTLLSPTAGMFVATVTSAGGTPTGYVDFIRNGTSIAGTGTLAAGSATSSFTLRAGESVVAYYPGDATHAASTSMPFSSTSMATSTRLSATASSTVLGQSTIRSNVSRIRADGSLVYPPVSSCSSCHDLHTGGTPGPTNNFLLTSALVAQMAIDGPVFPTGTVDFYDMSGGGTGLKIASATLGHGAASAVISGAPMVQARFVPGTGTTYVPSASTTVQVTANWIALASAPSRYAAAAASDGSKVYLMGGTVAGTGTFATASVYDPATDTWSALPTLSLAREYLSAASVGGKIYVFGGQAAGGTIVGTAEVFDPSNAALGWNPIPDLPRPRAQASAVVANGKIYVIGGWSTAGPSSAVDVYDPQKGAWAPARDIPTPRREFLAVEVGGLIYAVGGHVYQSLTPNWVPYVEVYAPAADAWTQIASSSMPTPLYAPAGGAIPSFAGGGTVYVMGGVAQSTGASSTIVEAYDVATNTWTTLLSMPYADDSAASTVIGGTLYVVGGHDNASGTSAAAFTP